MQREVGLFLIIFKIYTQHTYLFIYRKYSILETFLVFYAIQFPWKVETRNFWMGGGGKDKAAARPHLPAVRDYQGATGILRIPG